MGTAPQQQGVNAMQQRRLGRLGHRSSVLIYGAAALAEVDQDTADASVQLALDAGINHLDVAASYGDAELRLGPWMPTIRDRVFLATKTGLRDRDEAWAQINHSLERLQTDHLHQAPATHLEALRRFPFDTVLTPLNYILGQDPAYLGDYQALVAEIQANDAGLMIIKAASRRNWPEPDGHSYGTWYEPFDDQERIGAAVAWVLSHPEATGIATPGDVRLLPLLIEAERRLAETSRADAEQVLAGATDYSSPFIDIPI
jgi:hypothetical protein